MSDSTQTDQFAKSPFIFLFLVAVLVIATLVVASEYFLRPQIESDIQREVALSFVKAGLVEESNLLGDNKAALKQVWGIQQINNKTIIKNSKMIKK